MERRALAGASTVGLGADRTRPESPVEMVITDTRASFT